MLELNQVMALMEISSIGGFLIRWSDSTLHRSIYLSRKSELSTGGHYLNVHISCIALGRFFNANVVPFLGKKQ